MRPKLKNKRFSRGVDAPVYDRKRINHSDRSRIQLLIVPTKFERAVILSAKTSKLDHSVVGWYG